MKEPVICELPHKFIGSAPMRLALWWRLLANSVLQSNFPVPVRRLFRILGYQPHITNFWNAWYTAFFAKFLYSSFRNAPFLRCFGARYIYHNPPRSFFKIYQYNSKSINMNYISYLIELYRHIKKGRWTVKCNWVNEYDKKANRKIRLQSVRCCH